MSPWFRDAQAIRFLEGMSAGDHRFAFFHLRLGQFEDVNDTEMDASYFSRVVVQKSHDLIFKRSVDFDFLVYFAFYPARYACSSIAKSDSSPSFM